jgi:hypothetical protein
MTFKRIILLLIICLINNINAISQNLCKDYRIFDGYEPVLKCGMDTTQNWWIITEPVRDRYRLIINGKEICLSSLVLNTYLKNEYSSYVINSMVYEGYTNSEIILDTKIIEPIFSSNGMRWAVFASDNYNLSIITNDTVINLSTGVPGELIFSGNSQNIVYSYRKGETSNKVETEYIHYNKNTIEVLNRESQLFTDYYGYNVAFVVKRGNSFVMNINGKEFDYFEAVSPIGFWSDGSFLYAAKSGNGWDIYKNNKSISQIFKDIVEFKINLEGTVAALVVKNFANKYQALLISDEYYEPLTGKPYDAISNLALHPNVALYAYNAFEGVRPYVVFNSSEYSGTKYTSKPKFSTSGDEMYFIGCDIDCFLSINGKRYEVSNSIDISQNIAIASGTGTIAYSTSSSLIVKSLINQNINSGMMVDNITQPRYNWRNQKYEALGYINNKIYLLTCRPK